MALKDFTLNTSCDIEFNQQGDISQAINDKEFEQAMRNILLTNLGEWFLNTRFGTDWFQVLGQTPDSAVLQLVITEALTKDTRVVSVEDITLDVNTQGVATVSVTILGQLNNESITIRTEVNL